VAQPDVVYEAAIAATPRDLEAAQAFLSTLLGPNGRRALRQAGFGIPG
jgi:ABC-type molybdate transport system substrate-binding protein